MKKLFITLFLAWAGYGACAQNLVPNGSFEEYTTCPTYLGYPQYATGWQGLLSADYFHRCQSNLIVGVPFNGIGYQEPFDGDGYIGMGTAPFDWTREMVAIELTEPLQAGVPVCLSFKMAVGGFGSLSVNSAVYTANGMGLRFFNQVPNLSEFYEFPNSAALYMQEVPTDTSIWYETIGTYVPDSNYTHLVVGNFFSNGNFTTQVFDSTGYGNFYASYAFVDDIRVSFDFQYCESTGTGNGYSYRTMRVYPNPFVEEINVKLLHPAEGRVWWSVMDMEGRTCRTGATTAHSGQVHFNTDKLPAGVYVLNLNDDNGAYAPLRLVSVSP